MRGCAGPATGAWGQGSSSSLMWGSWASSPRTHLDRGLSCLQQNFLLVGDPGLLAQHKGGRERSIMSPHQGNRPSPDW